MGIESVPEPARAALRLMAVYNGLHPDVGLQEAADLAALLGPSDPMMSWNDDANGHFVVMFGDRPVLTLDMTALSGPVEESP